MICANLLVEEISSLANSEERLDTVLPFLATAKMGRLGQAGESTVPLLRQACQRRVRRRLDLLGSLKGPRNRLDHCRRAMSRLRAGETGLPLRALVLRSTTLVLRLVATAVVLHRTVIRLGSRPAEAVVTPNAQLVVLRFSDVTATRVRMTRY